MYAPLSSAVAFALLFVYIELRVAPEPILAPFLLKERIPVLVGVSNFLVATCNFTVMYNFPTWFQTVLLTSASEAGACFRARLVTMSAGGRRCGGKQELMCAFVQVHILFPTGFRCRADRSSRGRCSAGEPTFLAPC